MALKEGLSGLEYKSMQFAIVVDEAIDYPKELEEKFKVVRVPASLKLNGRDLSFASYEEIIELSREKGKLPRPGIAPPGRFLNAYRKLGKDYEVIISVHTTAKISGMINSARSAMNMYRGGAKIYLVDTGSSSLLAGLALYEALLRENSPDKLSKLIREFADRGNIVFYIKKMENLTRIRPVQGIKRILKGEISIKDAIKMAREKDGGFILTLKGGKIKLLDIVKNEEEAIHYLISLLEEKETMSISIGYIAKEEEAKTLEKLIEEKKKKRPFIIKMSRLVFCGTGPGIFGIAYLEA